MSKEKQKMNSKKRDKFIHYSEGEEPIKDYDVEIKETLSRVKTVQASSLGEAIEGDGIVLCIRHCSGCRRL